MKQSPQNPNQKAKKPKKKINRQVAKVLNRDNLYSRKLLMMNPYAQTLLDPFNKHGVRLPDECQFESVPFTVVQRITLTTSSAGVAFIAAGVFKEISIVSDGSLIPIPVNNEVTQIRSYVFGMSNNGTTSSDALNTTPTTIRLNQWQQAVGSNAITSAFDKIRLVSAGLNAQFTGNFTQNSGKYTAAFAPRNYSRLQEEISVDYVAAIPGSRVAPVSLNEGMTVRYTPTDQRNFQYTQLSGGLWSYDLAGSGVDLWEEEAQCSPGELWITMDGCEPGTTFQVTYVGNYEGIPLKNSFLLQSALSTSPTDPIALTHAIKLSETLPKVQSSSYEANASAMNKATQLDELTVQPSLSTQSTPAESQMFDSLLGVVDKVSNGINKVGSVVEKVLPFAEGLLAAI